MERNVVPIASSLQLASSANPSTSLAISAPVEELDGAKDQEKEPNKELPADHLPLTSHISARIRGLSHDNDSDVLSLWDFAKNRSPRRLFPDSESGEAAETGEPCFTVLHRPHQLRGQLDDQISDGSEPRGDPALNSLDPFPHSRRLSGPSRSLLKKYFDENVPVELAKDHTTVAFSEDQVYNLIRVACDETVHASFEMMNGLLQRASPLSESGKSLPKLHAIYSLRETMNSITIRLHDIKDIEFSSLLLELVCLE